MPAVVWPFTDTESNVPSYQDFDVATFMPRFCSAQAPKVAFLGDSTTLRTGNNSVGSDDNLAGYIMTRLREDNPSKSITFGNYAIPGSTLGRTPDTGTTLLGIGYSLPSWFTPTSSTWMSFVQSFAPDVLFVNFGINDAYTFTTGTLVTFLTSVCGWTKVPDIVFITNKGGTNNPTQSWIDGRLNAAALLRTISLSNARGISISNLPRIGILDVGRQFHRMVNGFDPCIQTLADVAVSSPVTTFPYSGQKTDGDLWFDFTFAGQGSAMQAAGTTITVGLGDPNGSTGASSFIVFSSPSGGQFYGNYYGGGSVSALSTNTNTWVAGTINIQIRVSGTHLLVYQNGTLAHDTQVVRYAGPFVPTVTLTNPHASPSMTINRLSIGKCRRVPPSMSTLEAYGPLDGSGNGINHGTSLSLNAIDRHLLQRLSFVAPLQFPGRLHTVAGAATLARDETVLGINKGTGAATVVNLPANPIPFKEYVVVDVKADAATNNITLTPASGNINGSATNVINTNRGYRRIFHDTTEWKIVGSA